MVESGSSRRGALLVIGIALLSYLPALWNGFVWDDRFQVLGNAIVQGQRSPLDAFTTHFWALGGEGAARSDYYRPLVTLSFWMDARIGAGSPWAFHLTNLVLHATASLGVLVAARRFGAGLVAATFAAGLFAAHPVHLESVAWVSGRTDVMATAFLLWALVTRGPASWVLGAAALLSKETAIVWPLLAAVRDRRWSWRERAPELVLVIAVMVVRRVVLGAAVAQVASLSPGAAVVGTFHLFGLFLVPWLDARMYVAPLDLAGMALVAAIGLVFVAIIGLRARRDRELRWWSAALAISLVPGAAGLALLQVHGARLMYLPSVFLCVILGAWLARRRAVARFVTPALVLGLALATALGSRAWRTERGFLARVAAHGPPEALMNLAVAEHDEGDLLAAWGTLARLEATRPLPESAYLRGVVLAELGCGTESARAFTRALELRPGYREAWTNLASLLRTQGRPQGALAIVSAARAQGVDSAVLRRIEAKARGVTTPERPLATCSRPIEHVLADPAALQRAALDRGREGEPRQGLALVRAALRVRPDWPEALVTEAQLHYLAGEPSLAVRSAERALALDPAQSRAWKPLGLAALAAGQRERGREALARYLELHPDAPDAADLRRHLP